MSGTISQDRLIFILRSEIIRQSEAEGEAPWIGSTHEEMIRIDGGLNLRELADALIKEMKRQDD